MHLCERAGAEMAWGEFSWEGVKRLLHRASFAERSFTQRSFYTEKLVYRDDFTHRRFCTEKLSRRKTQSSRDLYTLHQEVLHRGAFTEWFSHRLYKQKLLDTDAFTHKKVLHTHTPLYGARRVLHSAACTQLCISTKALFTQRSLLRRGVFDIGGAFTQKKLLHRNFCRQYAFTQRQRGFAPPSWSPIFRFPLSSSFNWAICRSSHQKVDRHTMCTGSCGRATQFSATLRVFVVIRCLDWNQLVNFWVYRDYTGIYRYIQVYLLQSKAAMPTNSVLVSWLHCISFAKIQAWTSCNFCRVADGFSRELHCTSSLSSETTVPSSNPCVAGVTVFPLAPIHPYELLAVLQAIWSPSFKSMVSFECIQWHFPLSSWHDGFRAFEFQGKLQAPESDFIDD